MLTRLKYKSFKTCGLAFISSQYIRDSMTSQSRDDHFIYLSVFYGLQPISDTKIAI